MRYIDPKCRKCRREKQKLFLKSERCYSPQCPLEKKGAIGPGEQGTRQKRRLSEFGQQLREKQKTKSIYGLNEAQFKRYFYQAWKKKGSQTGKALLQILESRLDNIVFRLGLAPSRSVARQLVSHGHIRVDNQKVNIPSYSTKPGQIITLTDHGLKNAQVKKMLANKDYRLPLWLQRKAAVGKMVRFPERNEIDTEIDEKLILEYYSR